MKRLSFCLRLAAILLAVAVPCAAADSGEQPPQEEPAIVTRLQAAPSQEAIRDRWLAYMQEQNIPAQTQAEVLELWEATEEEEKLNRMVASIAILHPEWVSMAEASRRSQADHADAEAWREQSAVPPLVRDPLQLWVALGWIQQGRHAEAAALLDGIATDRLVDPVSYAFALSVIHHQRANKQQGLELLEWLRKDADAVPQRYRVLAELMYDDLQQLEPGSLDDISRRMKQIRQQLDLGRTGEGVLRTEDEVIEMLDKLIEEESKKQASQSQSASSGGAPSRPAEESRLAGGKGAGQVTKRPVGKSSGWGDLPPKEREEAMQEISREFPAHYRKVIEAYFRELARQQQ